MPLPPPHGTYSEPLLGIGNPQSLIQDILLTTDSFDRDIAWRLPDPNDCKAPYLPADFTGYTPLAEILDADGNIVETFTVTPLVGDATGTFSYSLTPAQTTPALAAVAVSWRFRLVLAPSFQETYLIAPFVLRTH